MLKRKKNRSSVRRARGADETQSMAAHIKTLLDAGRDEEAARFVDQCVEDAEAHIEDIQARTPELAAYFAPTSGSVH